MQTSNQSAHSVQTVPISPANLLQPKTSGVKEALYKYGTKPIPERMYVCFSAKTNEIAMFNKTSFQYFQRKSEEVKKACRNPEKEDGEENQLNQVLEGQNEEVPMDIEGKSPRPNKGQSELNNALMNKETAESISNFFENQPQPAPKQIDDPNFKVHI